MKFKVAVLQRHIDDGDCGDTRRCMERLALLSALIKYLDLDEVQIRKLHVKIDGAKIKFNYKGYRWLADTPRVAKDALILFDQNRRDEIVPHKYTVTAVKTSKIIPFTPDRMDQINKAKQVRIAEGREKTYPRRITAHQRVVGLAPGNI